MSKHTPGPWVENISEDGSIEVWNADYSMFIAKRHQMNDRDEAEANARLAVGGYLDLSGTGITSLPDGLTVGGYLYLDVGTFNTVAVARAAIAKAKGE